MKNKFSILIMALVVITFATSCKKTFFTDANINPNAPSDVPPASLLAPVEISLGYTQGGDMSRYTSMFTQQTNGVARQSQAYYQYIFTGQDFDGLWSNLYTSCMENDLTLMNKADESGYNVYSGIARLIMAYSLQITVDCWGSVPYSNALQGLETMHPTYDSDQDLYATINQLIDDGIANLSNADPGAVVPSDDDFIYGGVASKWIMFGHALKARLDIHQSKSDPSKATDALNEIAQSFQSNADNAQVSFFAVETSSNPWYQFNEQRGDISFSGSTLAADMLSLNDPRYSILIDSTNDALGLGLAPYYGDVAAPVELITYDELTFIEAEATIRSGGAIGTAEPIYQEAIQANMEKLGVAGSDITTYITANGTLPTSSNDAAIAQIAHQEWFALYLNPEAWSVWRRTDSPSLIPAAGNLGIPRRFIYPQNEYSYNGDNTPDATLFTPPLFWDN